MFSFVGDVVLDPFSGTGTTSVGAARSGRNSVGIEVEPAYQRMAMERLRETIAAERLRADAAPHLR
jgi:DNA modification methylase